MVDKDRSGLTTADELALLVESVEDYALFFLEPNGGIRSWNRGAARIFGYSEEEVIGRIFSIFYSEDDIAAKKPARELETAASAGRVEDEGWRIRKNGERFWANTIITAMHDARGALIGFAKITRDLTKRREAEERVRRSEELFRLLVESVQDYAIFMLDPQGNVISWNAGAQRIKGYRREEIIGRHFSTFYPEEDKQNGKPERELEAAREQGSVRDEGIRVRKDGTTFWANVVITAVHDENGELRGFAKVTRDISERKKSDEMQNALLEQREARVQAEHERRLAETSYRAAQEANRAKDEFLMTLSHELRTPMTAILGWARLLPGMALTDPIFREAIASIARGAELQAHLIDDVLDVSRIVSGKMHLSRETIDVARVITASLEAVRPSADAKLITITTSLSPALGDLVADPTRLQQVMWNLLSNAVKFTPRNGVIEVSARRTASNVEIAVKDSGQGIDPRFIPHVFEPFRQAENPSTRVHGGLGLGLSIVRYIVEAHGGTVHAQSGGQGQGATFTVTLPIGALAPQALDIRALEQRKLLPDRLANVRVLLVDDDHDARLMLRSVLRQAGATVADVESASMALDQLSYVRPGVIITDIAMPQMDGYEFSRNLRERLKPGDVKIIALTAFPVGSMAAERKEFDAYLAKPIDPFELVETVATIVATRGESRSESASPGRGSN